MKNTKILMMTAMLTSSLLLCYPVYTADGGKTSLPKRTPQEIKKEVEAKNEGAAKRVRERSKARDLQDTGQKVESFVQKASKPASYAGTIASLSAAATGDPHAKMGAAGFRLSIEAIKALGIGVAKIITITGRYQERAQKILSGAEVELEDLQRLLDKKKKLEKNLDELLKVEKAGQPSESSSKLKQLGKGVSNLAKSTEIKVRQATDILTNDKQERGKEIEAIQAELKEINKKYKERISSLEIRVIREIIKEIDKKINLDNTISILEDNRTVYAHARSKEGLSKNKSKRKKQEAEIDVAEVENNNDLIYFMKFKASPTETLEELKKSRAELTNEERSLSELTDRGDAIYLQEKDVQLDSEVNRTAIVGLYKEIDAIKNQLETLSKTAPTKDMGSPPGPKQSLEMAKSQKGITPKPEVTKSQAISGGPSKEAVIEQKKALPRLPEKPLQGTAKGG
jgi:hypothetical protein